MEEKAAMVSMVFVRNINQSVDLLLKTSSLFDPFPQEMGTDTAFLDRITISGTMIKVDELANTLQVCLDSGAKKVLLPSISFVDFAGVPADLMSAFQLIPYQSAEDAVFKALGVDYT